MTGIECANNWKQICAIYDETRWDKTPADTMDAIVKSIGRENAYTTFATIAKLKEHDGRIYGKQREEMSSAPYITECVEYTRDNPLFRTGLCDHIHTAHINQLIGELIRR